MGEVARTLNKKKLKKEVLKRGLSRVDRMADLQDCLADAIRKNAQVKVDGDWRV